MTPCTPPAERIQKFQSFPLTGEFLLYQTWLTQAQIAKLFQTTTQNVTLHLKAIFVEGELVEGATCKDFLQVRQEGGWGTAWGQP